jgi:hypothetical protein
MLLNINFLSVPTPDKGTFPLIDFAIIVPNKKGKHRSIFLKQLSYEFKEIYVSHMEELWRNLNMYPK